jgi:hypothetical protein
MQQCQVGWNIPLSLFAPGFWSKWMVPQNGLFRVGLDFVKLTQTKWYHLLCDFQCGFNVVAPNLNWRNNRGRLMCSLIMVSFGLWTKPKITLYKAVNVWEIWLL